MKICIRLFALTFAFLVMSGVEALACSCMTGIPPCQTYWEASAVFVGRRVGERTVTVEEGEGANKYKREQRVFRFAVERAFRGVTADFVEVQTGLGSGDCGIFFNHVDRYLVYAYDGAKGGRLWTNMCTRTAPVAAAAEDLQYIAGLSPSGVSAGGTIYGRVNKQVRESRGEEQDEVTYAPVAGARVEIEGGGKSFGVETDGEGRYRAAGLAPGDYSVRLKLPDTLLIHAPVRKVKIEGSGCASETFTVEPNGRLSGRVFDAEGRPASRAGLVLSAAEKKDKAYRGHVAAATTDAEGRYEFHGIPPGRYIIRMRPDAEQPYGGAPYPAVYHPNVRDPAKAEAVGVGEGERVEAYDLHLPPRPAERTVEGVVTYADGAPAAGVDVNYSSPEDPDTQGGAKTDAEGRFSFRGYEALSYRVMANVWSAGKDAWVSSKQADVPAGGPVEPLRIVVPRP